MTGAIAHVGELTFSFFMVVCHLNPQEHIRLWHDDAGKMVGYAILGEDPSFDCQVLPEYEWSRHRDGGAGLGGNAPGRTARAATRNRWGGNLVSGARQDNAKRIAFLEQHGFRYSGEFAEVNMLRSLDEPIPASALPAGCQVRAMAEAGEISNRAAAQREVWQPWTVGNVSDDDYARFMQLPGYHRDLDVVDRRAGWRHRRVREWLDRPGQPDRRFWPGGRAPGLPPARIDPRRAARRFAPDAGARDGPRLHLDRGVEYACAAPV